MSPSPRPRLLLRGLVALLALPLLAASCRSTAPLRLDDPIFGTSGPAAPRGHAWRATFTPPEAPATERIRLEVLTPAWAELDWEAFMGSREHLRRTLHWGSWPSEDFPLEQNRVDLARHEAEYANREAYAYTVLEPDASRAVGCLYLNPLDAELSPREARLAFWVIEPELASDLDVHLVETILEWIEAEWPLDTVTLPLHVENERGASILEVLAPLGVTEETPEDQPAQRVFVWRR